MTPEEVARFVLVPLSSAWPKERIPDATARLWAHELRSVAVKIAEETTEIVLREEIRFPAPGVWRKAAQRVARTRASEDGQLAIPAPRVPRDEALGKIAELRAQLRKADDPRQETESPQDHPTTQGEPDASRHAV